MTVPELVAVAFGVVRFGSVARRGSPEFGAGE
jgi:hypothetical protein